MPALSSENAKNEKNVAFFIVDEKFFPFAYANALRIIQLANHDISVEIFLEAPRIPRYPQIDGVNIRHNQLMSLLPENLPFNERLPPIVWARIMAPKVLQQYGYQRALYLDADIAIVSDISGIFLTVPSSTLFAATPDTFAELPAASPEKDLWAHLAEIGLQRHRYFNAGIMLFDIDYWVKLGLDRRVSHHAQKFGATARMLDQDFLNLTFQDVWKKLSPRWNFQGMLFCMGLEQCLNPVIVHYTIPVKPWWKNYLKHDKIHGEYFERALDNIGLSKINRRQFPLKPSDSMAKGARTYFRNSLFKHNIATPHVKKNLRKWNFLRHHMFRFVRDGINRNEFCDISSIESKEILKCLEKFEFVNPKEFKGSHFCAVDESWPGIASYTRD